MNIKFGSIVTIILIIVFGRLEIVDAQQSPPKETSCQQSAKEILSEIDAIYDLSAASDKVLVTGEVYAPRLLANEKQLSLTKALAVVGGISRTARRSVYLLRQAADGEAQIILGIDLNEIRTGRTKDILLENGDIVFVPGHCSHRKTMPLTDTPIKPSQLIDAPIRFPKAPFAQKRLK